ncbi:MAG: efflux RND transporter periplasmic adaptor subunit [Parachlamydiales bacterium]|nr:efflux RND transporter periplasmic adaptor subunit [Parachlamydiales bacterium]
MKRFLFLGVFLTLIIFATAIVTYVISHPSKNKRELVLYGNVDVREVDIGFRVAGQVEQLFFEEGDIVTTGMLLSVLDKTPYVSQVEEAQARIRAVQAHLENAKIMVQRREELIKVGGVSQEDLDDARTNQEVLTADLSYAEAALVVAQDNLRYTEVYAPTEGTILTRIREPGTVVNPSDPVYTISVASPVWIRAFVSEPQLGKIYYGMAAEIITDTEGGPIYHGKIGFISPVAEFTPKTVETTELRTDLVYRLRIYVDNPDHYLKQGMPVTIKLLLDGKKYNLQGKK